MKGASRALARRYARALLEVAIETRADPRVLRDELRQVAGLLAGHPELGRVLADPVIPAARKKNVVGALWEMAKPTPLLRRIVDLLVASDRLALLTGLEEAFTEEWNEGRGAVSAHAVSAVELQPAQKEALLRGIADATGLTVELETRLDPAVLGGLLVRMGGKTYDGTVRGRLKALREGLVARR